VQAFERYAERTEARIQSEVRDPKRFCYVDSLPEGQKAQVLSRLRKGDIVIQSMTTSQDETPIQVPGGLVHHWMAIAFIPGVSAGQVLALEQDYPRYGDLYKPDVQYAKVLSREGQHYRVYYRFYRNAIVSVVYDAEFEVGYVTPDASKNYSVARTTRLAEVENAGKQDEKEYPVGKDHGYMWRLNLYTRCVERDGGVYLQVEFLELSRAVPPVLSWFVDPYLRSIPRDYLRRYLETTRKALRLNRELDFCQ
jgi:hypothetical protein